MMFQAGLRRTEVPERVQKPMKRSKMATFLLTDTSRVLKSGGDVQTENVETSTASGSRAIGLAEKLHDAPSQESARRLPGIQLMCQQYPQSEPTAFWMRAKA